MSAAKEKWYALDVEVEPQAREAVEYALIEAGAAGTATDDTNDRIQVTGYFSGVPDRERVREELFEALRIYELPSSSVRDMDVREVEQRDWLEEWKKNWQPVEVGSFHHRAALVRARQYSQSTGNSHRAGHGFWHGYSRNYASLSRRGAETFYGWQFSRRRHRHRDSCDCCRETCAWCAR